MTERARIVVIRDPAGDLARLLEARPERPSVEVAESLFDALEQTLDDPPETLFHDGSLDDPEEVGALRVLRLALPNLRLVLLGPSEREFELSALAERLRAQVLTRPFDRRAVAAALGHADVGDGRPDPEAFLDKLWTVEPLKDDFSAVSGAQNVLAFNFAYSGALTNGHAV